VATVAPLAATATANAASNRLSIHPVHHLTKAQMAAIGKLTPAELAKHGAGTAEPGLDRSQFPAHGQVAAMLQLNLRPASRVYVSVKHLGSTADAVSAAREQRARNVHSRLHLMAPRREASVASDAHNRRNHSANDRKRLGILEHVALLSAVEKRAELEVRSGGDRARTQDLALDSDRANETRKIRRLRERLERRSFAGHSGRHPVGHQLDELTLKRAETRRLCLSRDDRRSGHG